MSKEKKYELDIFELLNHINHKDIKYYRELTEEQKKEFSPYKVLLWMRGTSTPMQLGFLNALLNPYVFRFKETSLYKEDHSELLYYLMTLCAIRPDQRYKWLKLKSKEKSISKIIEVIKKYYGYSTREANMMLPLLSNHDIMDHARDLGLQTEEITSIKKELENR